jgi:ketosteroid isomerase-like protein
MNTNIFSSKDRLRGVGAGRCRMVGCQYRRAIRAALHTLQQKTESVTRSSGLPSQPMNLYLGMITFLFALTLIQGCTGNGDSPPSQQIAKRDVITQEEGLIVTTLNEVASAESQFYSTKDTASIVGFYAQDYAGIKGGKTVTVQDKNKYLTEVLDRVNRGEPIGISSKFMNIKSSVEGPLGWATYEYEYKVTRSGVLQGVSQGQCTVILKKQAGSWLIQHEHCSTVSPTAFFLQPR